MREEIQYYTIHEFLKKYKLPRKFMAIYHMGEYSTYTKIIEKKFLWFGKHIMSINDSDDTIYLKETDKEYYDLACEIDKAYSAYKGWQYEKSYFRIQYYKEIEK